MAAMNGRDYDEEAALAREMQNAQRATDILNNPLFVEVYGIIEARIIKEWLNTAPRDVETRERAWHRWQALRDIRSTFVGMLDDGKVADAQLRADIARRES